MKKNAALQWIVPITLLLGAALAAILHLNVAPQPDGQNEKIGFIILGDIRKPGWNASHYQGIKKAADELGLELLVRDNVRENSGDCRRAIEELAADGVGMVYLCSYGYASEVKDLVEAHPKIAFATNSAEIHLKNMTSYFARMYQGRYLAGALAGMKTKAGVIGYVAARPNTEVRRGINAFALGVQRTNPDAKVVVAWTGSWENAEKEDENARRLVREAGADVLAYHQDDLAVPDAAEEMGVDFIGYNTRLEGYSGRHLTDVLCRWDVYYQHMLLRYLKGELNYVKDYWFGIEQDAIALSDYSDGVTEEMRRTIASLEHELAAGGLIFSGVIYDRDGNLRCDAGEAISDDALLERVDWLLKGVEILGDADG